MLQPDPHLTKLSLGWTEVLNRQMERKIEGWIDEDKDGREVGSMGKEKTEGNRFDKYSLHLSYSVCVTFCPQSRPSGPMLTNTQFYLKNGKDYLAKRDRKKRKEDSADFEGDERKESTRTRLVKGAKKKKKKLEIHKKTARRKLGSQ